VRCSGRRGRRSTREYVPVPIRIVTISKFTFGRQPCAKFRHSENPPARRCQQCPDAVKWCEACGQDHHGWGWETCDTRLDGRPTEV